MFQDVVYGEITMKHKETDEREIEALELIVEDIRRLFDQVSSFSFGDGWGGGYSRFSQVLEHMSNPSQSKVKKFAFGF